MIFKALTTRSLFLGFQGTSLFFYQINQNTVVVLKHIYINGYRLALKHLSFSPFSFMVKDSGNKLVLNKISRLIQFGMI